MPTDPHINQQLLTYGQFKTTLDAYPGAVARVRAVNVGKGKRLTVDYGGLNIETYIHPGTPEWTAYLADVAPKIQAGLTETGDPRVVNTYGDPDRFAPKVTSIAGFMKRDGSDGTQETRTESIQRVPVGVKRDLTVGTPVHFYKMSMYWPIVGVRHGLQQANACWKRNNEGDFCEVVIEVPSSLFTWQPTTAYLAGQTPPVVCINGGNMYACVQSGTSASSGGPTGTTPETPIVDGTAVWYYAGPDPSWFDAFTFAEFVTIFGDNPPGTQYPSAPTPAVSWLEVGWRVRVDVYKKATNDPEYVFGEGQNETTNPEKRGPWVDIDLLLQLER